MEPYWERFAELALRDETNLDADEIASRDYFIASVDEIDGLPANTPARHWCRLAREVGRLAHQLGRLPVTGDPGAAPRYLRWIEDQREAELNSYQRACLAAMPGWELR